MECKKEIADLSVMRMAAKRVSGEQENAWGERTKVNARIIGYALIAK